MDFDNITNIQINSDGITELYINNTLVWQKKDEESLMILIFDGITIDNTSFHPYGDDIVKIDFGDGTIERRNSKSDGHFGHTYQEDGLHTITFYGITRLTNAFPNFVGLKEVIIKNNFQMGASFNGCLDLTNVTIPKSMTKTSQVIFYGCENLENYDLYWDSSEEIRNFSQFNYSTSSTTFTVPYGTTDLYVAKGYPSDRLIERELPTLTLSTEKDIISKYKYYDEGDLEEIASLNITLTGNDKSNKNIIIKANGTQIDTVQTNNKGFATYSYIPQGNGDIEFTAEYGDLISNSCHIIDAKYYASNETISSAPSYNNDGTLFASDYTLSEGDKVHFRFKSIPNRCIYGFGSTAGSDFVFEKTGTTLKYWRNVLSNGSYDNPSYMPSTEYDIVMEFTKYNASTYRMKLYKGDTYVDYWTCGNSIKKVRVDKFFNDDFEIEVFVL